jgi:glycosyltransferase involved in cell wall biosynthesis
MNFRFHFFISFLNRAANIHTIRKIKNESVKSFCQIRRDPSEILLFAVMPRVLRIINRFCQEGPIYNAAYLGKHLKDYDTLVVGGSPLPHERDTRKVFNDLEVPTEIIPGLGRSIHPLHDLQVYYQLKQVIKRFQPDIIHSHSFGHYGLAARFAANHFPNVLKVHTYHGHLFSTYHGIRKSIYTSLEKRLAKSWDAQIAISASQRIELIDAYGICDADKVHVIPLGIDTKRFETPDDSVRKKKRASLGITNDEICIGIIARLDPIKNHTLFIDAIHELTKRNYKVRALVIGDGSLRDELHQHAQQLNLLEGINPKLQFLSWQEKIEDVLPAVDIVALTSHSEGTPVSLLEAQAASLPIVSTDVGGVRDIMMDKVTGYLVPANHLSTLVEKIIVLINDSSLRTSMGNAGRTYVNGHYSYTRLTASMDELYMNLSHQKPNEH